MKIANSVFKQKQNQDNSLNNEDERETMRAKTLFQQQALCHSPRKEAKVIDLILILNASTNTSFLSKVNPLISL